MNKPGVLHCISTTLLDGHDSIEEEQSQSDVSFPVHVNLLSSIWRPEVRSELETFE